MSNQQWPPPTRTPGAGGAGGSVRAARERMEAGLPPSIPQPPRPAPPNGQPQVSGLNTPARGPRQPGPPGLSQIQSVQAPIGVAISRPTPKPQWPLGGSIEGQGDRNITAPQYQPPASRGPPPQRPPRPSHVPSMLEASRLQEPTPSFQRSQYQADGGYDDEDIISPILASPLTQSSRSSVGEIPDFPVPVAPPGPPRRSANLGPPPSARRGASSYYSQVSFVSPIPEESPRAFSHLSYASSAAIPTSWGSDSPRGYGEYDDMSEYEDETPYDRFEDERERGFRSPTVDTIDEERDENGHRRDGSRGSIGDDSDDRGLIRSASFGRRAKPTMIQTRNSTERLATERPAPMPQQRSKLEKMGVVGGAAGGAGAEMTAATNNGGQRETVWPMIGTADSPLAGGTGFIDKSSSDSDNSIPQIPNATSTDRTASPTEPKQKAMLAAYNSASGLKPSEEQDRALASPSPGFSRLSAIRRPPRLNIDAVRDAEARGSLTSLPDLIRRATRLAAMMDRGKRPSSRMALSDWPDGDDMARDKEMGYASEDKRRSGLSGMLNAFPAAGVQTPRDGTPRPNSPWPELDQSEGGKSSDPNNPNRKRPGRRCCGLPCWGAIVILFIVLVLIAAAVVVPLELLVLNKTSTSSAKTLSAVEKCQADTATKCQNGGIATMNGATCACVCTNGFTGSTCTTNDDIGCAKSSTSNNTMGDSIARLISGAQTNFSVPLSENSILARFNSANLTCASENALVTFDGESERLGSSNSIVTPTTTSTTSSGSSSTSAAAKVKGRRDDTTTTSTGGSTAATTHGIVYDSSPQATTTTSSSAAATSSVNPDGVFYITEEVLDFARVAVLYVLQEEALDSAISAQSALQKFFTLQSFTNKAAMNVSLGSGNWADLGTFSVDVGSGEVGGKNSSGDFAEASTGWSKRESYESETRDEAGVLDKMMNRHGSRSRARKRSLDLWTVL